MSDFWDRSQVTILLVDDNLVNIKLEQDILEKAGYATNRAMTGLAAIETARKLKPDLVLLDICMPEISGIEVCRILSQDEQTMHIPVIFVTANSDNETLKTAFACGGKDFVTKPVNRMEMLVRIESVLTQERLRQMFFKKEKLKGVLEMAGAVCHELNQPMQAALGYAQLLMMDIEKANPLYDLTQKIGQQIEEMGEITKKIMNITKYETKNYLQGKKIVDIDKASL